MMIKMNAKESVEIVEDVFVNVINEKGGKYQSWDELSESQQECFTQMKKEFQETYAKYKTCMD
ncbi:MAG: hypothetical protein OQK50_09230 [Deltaproteobacteria bacterium]|jgi:hypothetical protein|nr:hypothetical protein [Deltaproteobacteria bacterium]MCW9050499.1 hypothetical protein [Deltaproteobacteria bacterium]